MELWKSDESKEEDVVVIDSEEDRASHAVQNLIQREILNSTYPRLLIIKK